MGVSAQAPSKWTGRVPDLRRLQHRRAVLRREREVERRADAAHRCAQVDQDRLHLRQHDVETLAVEVGEGVADGRRVEAPAAHGHAEHVALAAVEEVRLVRHLHGGDRAPSSASSARPSAAWSARMRSAAAASTSSSGWCRVRTKSWRTSASTQPSADVMPGKRGTST